MSSRVVQGAFPRNQMGIFWVNFEQKLGDSSIDEKLWHLVAVFESRNPSRLGQQLVNTINPESMGGQ